MAPMSPTQLPNFHSRFCCPSESSCIPACLLSILHNLATHPLSQTLIGERRTLQSHFQKYPLPEFTYTFSYSGRNACYHAELPAFTMRERQKIPLKLIPRHRKKCNTPDRFPNIKTWAQFPFDAEDPKVAVFIAVKHHVYRLFSFSSETASPALPRLLLPPLRLDSGCRRHCRSRHCRLARLWAAVAMLRPACWGGSLAASNAV